MLYQNVECC